MEVDNWVALAVTAVTLLSLFVALPRLGFGLLSLLFAWWAGSVVSQWIVVHGPPELVAITSSMDIYDWVALAVTAAPLLSLFVALPRLGFGLLSLLFAWWAGSVVSQWILVRDHAITQEIEEVLTYILIGASLVIIILRYCCSCRCQANRYQSLDDLIA